MLEHLSFDAFNIVYEARKTQVKRKYTDKHPGRTVQHVTPVRNKILRFIASKGRVTRAQLIKFFEGMNRLSGRRTSMSWIYKNKKLVQNRKFRETRYYFLTSLGQRVLHRTSANESESVLEMDGGATLGNIPGMGNSQPPSYDGVGSGDTFDAVGSPGEELEESKDSEIQVKIMMNVPNGGENVEEVTQHWLNFTTGIEIAEDCTNFDLLIPENRVAVLEGYAKEKNFKLS